MLDVSNTGCRLDAVDRPEVGERVWIKFEGLESIESTVCWVAGFKVGLKYCNPIHPAVFDRLLKGFNGCASDR
ncbi:MAG: PilZ domain-containing protein [Pseudomonadota bacterium]|nr:PilZ domain-containing protein [Pseudomonadota bacterium]